MDKGGGCAPPSECLVRAAVHDMALAASWSRVTACTTLFLEPLATRPRHTR